MNSAFVASASFPHRANQDGTIDSICPRCYVTIGTSTLEADLASMESAHTCDPAILRHFQENEATKMPPSREELAKRQSRRRYTV